MMYTYICTEERSLFTTTRCRLPSISSFTLVNVTTSRVLSFLQSLLSSYPTCAIILLALFYTTSSSLFLSGLVIFVLHHLSSFVHLLELDLALLLDLNLNFPPACRRQSFSVCKFCLLLISLSSDIPHTCGVFHSFGQLGLDHHACLRFASSFAS